MPSAHPLTDAVEVVHEFGRLPLFNVYARLPSNGFCHPIDDYDEAPRTFQRCLDCVIGNNAVQHPRIAIGVSGGRRWANVRVATPVGDVEFHYRTEAADLHASETWSHVFSLESLDAVAVRAADSSSGKLN